LPLISVCIANYNGVDIIGPCIESVLRQQTEAKIEILVHDDASTDKSVEYIKSNFPQVALFQSSNNIGYCASNNLLAENAKGKFLLFLNNDAALFADAIATFIEYSSAGKKSSILGLPQFDMESREIIDYGCLFDIFLNPVAVKSPNRNNVGMIIGACLWIPRSIWKELGGFPNWFESLSEDMYLCMYAHILGYEIVVLPKSGYYHRVGHSFGGGKLIGNKMITTFTRRYLSERNKSFVMILFFPPLLFYSIFPVHLFLLTFEGLLLSLLKCNAKIFSRIYFPALIDIWNKILFLYKARSAMQPKRAISYKLFLSVFTPMPIKLRMLIKHGLPTIR